MELYITRANKTSPVAIKPGGSKQGEIGKSTTIQVVKQEKGYAQFVSPVVIQGKENWIRMEFITKLEPDPVPEEDPPTTDPNDVMLHYVGGALVETFERRIE